MIYSEKRDADAVCSEASGSGVSSSSSRVHACCIAHIIIIIITGVPSWLRPLATILFPPSSSLQARRGHRSSSVTLPRNHNQNIACRCLMLQLSWCVRPVLRVRKSTNFAAVFTCCQSFHVPLCTEINRLRVGLLTAAGLSVVRCLRSAVYGCE